jgi:hypothetical protein
MSHPLERSLRHALPFAALLAAAPACVGLDPGVTYPDESIDVDDHVLSPEGAADPSLTLGGFKIKPGVCKDIDTHPITQTLTPDDLTRFLEARGIKVTPKKARGNLYWYEFANGEDPPDNVVRLRLAVLPTASAAADDLHRSLLEHGPGWWGLRRSNLAVLAPGSDVEGALAFALSRKLVCWGMFTMADADDAYVVPGPYTEL